MRIAVAAISGIIAGLLSLTVSPHFSTFIVIALFWAIGVYLVFDEYE